jgi:RimJ/RimL family protein N-acetyltransferase
VIVGALATARLHLRALARSDLALFTAMYCDKETMRHIGRPLSPERALASLRATMHAARQPDGPRFLVIIERRSRRAVGLCSIRPGAGDCCPEVGIMLVRGARGCGYAAEALAALIDVAFRALPITAVSVQYRLANTASAQVFDALGFSRVTTVGPGPCVRILRRRDWHSRPQPSMRGTAMSNIIGFLEQAGRNATLRHATRAQLLTAMHHEGVASTSFDSIVGVREKMYCALFPVKTPTPKKAPPKKKPAKAPPKKKPAKKPATKKAPAKKKKR